MDRAAVLSSGAARSTGMGLLSAARAPISVDASSRPARRRAWMEMCMDAFVDSGLGLADITT